MDYSEVLSLRVVGCFETAESIMPKFVRDFFGSFTPHNIDNWMRILYPLIVVLAFNHLPYEIVYAYSHYLLLYGPSMGSTGIFPVALGMQISMFCFSVFFVWR